MSTKLEVIESHPPGFKNGGQSRHGLRPCSCFSRFLMPAGAVSTEEKAPVLAGPAEIHVNTVTQRMVRITKLLDDGWQQHDRSQKVYIAQRLHRISRSSTDRAAPWPGARWPPSQAGTEEPVMPQGRSQWAAVGARS